MHNNRIPIWQLLPKILLKLFQDLYVPFDEDQVETLGHEVERKRFAGFVTCAIDDGIRLLTSLSGDLLRWSGGWDLLLLGTSGCRLLLRDRVLIGERLQKLLAIEEAPEPAGTIVQDASEAAPQME